MEKVEAALNPYIKKSDRMEHGFEISFQPIADVYLGPAYMEDNSEKAARFMFMLSLCWNFVAGDSRHQLC